MEKICIVCGKPFEAKRSDAKFCGPTCRQRNKRGSKIKQDCIVCGKPVSIGRGGRKYCSDECSETAHIINRTHGSYRRSDLYYNDTGAWDD